MSGILKEDMNLSGVYEFWNVTRDRNYVGMAGQRNFGQRLEMHLSALNNGKHHNKQMQADWSDGENDAWSFEIVSVADPENCHELERELINLIEPFYNVQKQFRER